MSAPEQQDAPPSETQPDPEIDASVLRALPGLLRIAGSAWWRTTEWTVGASARAGARLVKAAVSGESTAELFKTTGSELRQYLRELLDVRRDESSPAPGERASPNAAAADGTTASLRRRGEELLRRSADVRFEEDAHPAYARILDQLAPDEGRILRLLALEGPQPAVDVRTGRPLNVGSQLVAPGLSMIAAEAGCRHPDRLPAYLNNVYRLGLIWFSREPLTDPLRYQVLEAQPDVVAAMRGAGRARTVRRSIHLTPFGDDFCATCLPLHTAELDALPGGGDRGAAAERSPGGSGPPEA
jgi:abortive infection alpha-like protein